ncbi:MAG: ABC transporter substrate-binding protein [Acidimicrobiales bacterium]
MKRTLAVVLTAVALAAACGDDTTATDTTAADTTSDDGSPDAPQRIVSLSATSTEMLFAIGAGDQVVAVDSMSNHPPEAPMTDLSAYEPNVEAIATYDPDLVVLDATDPDLISGLETLGIEVMEAPAAATLEDTYAQLEELGEVTGHVDDADDVVAGMRSDIDAALDGLPERDEPLTYYPELDDTLFSVTSETFIGELYTLAGLENVADPADADGQSGGYPQLSTEYLVQTDPDLVFLADTKCCAQTAETFAARPGFSALTAVEDDRVILLDDDIASRWGPRVVDLLEQIVEAVSGIDDDMEEADAA